MAARVYRSTLAAVASAFPTGGATQKDFRIYDENAGATYDRTDTGTVPATPYTIELDLVPLQNFGVTITVATVARTIVAYGTQASGQVGVDFVSGLVAFHSSDTGLAYSVGYRGIASGVSATDLNIIQNEIGYLRTLSASYVVGPASSTDNAIVRWDGTTGKLAQNSNCTISDAGAGVFASTLSASNLSGTNSGDITLADVPTQNVFGLSTQALSLDTQTANLVFASPTSGGAAAPTFRALVSEDIPLAFTGTSGRSWTYTDDDPTPGFDFYHKSGTTFGAAGTAVGLFRFEVQDTTTGFDHIFIINGTSSASDLTRTLTLPAGSGTFAITATSPIVLSATTGNLTLGTVGVTFGGTGLTTCAQGDLLYGSASNTLSALAKDANATRYLSNTGTSNNPAWAQVNVANGITGTVPIANGGTNSTATPTNGYFAKGDGTTYTFFDLMGGTNTWTGINTFSNKIVNSATLTADGYLYTGTLTSATANLADLVAVKGTLAKSGSDNDGGDTATVNQYAGQFSATDTGTITDTGGSTYNTFGVKGSGSDSGANTSGNANRNTFGGDFSASSTGAITAGTPIRNSYGVRGVATGTTGGTSTAYGVYGSASGADVNWGGYFEGNLAATGTLGYTTGAGGTVTQATSKATGVTLDKACGTITMHAATLNAATAVSFTLTNSKISATDVLIIQHDSAGTLGAYVVAANTMASGSCQITVRNISAGNLGEAIVLRFALVKGVVT